MFGEVPTDQQKTEEIKSAVKEVSFSRIDVAAERLAKRICEHFAGDPDSEVIVGRPSRCVTPLGEVSFVSRHHLVPLYSTYLPLACDAMQRAVDMTKEGF